MRLPVTSKCDQTPLRKLAERMNEEQSPGEHDRFRSIADDLIEKVYAVAGDDIAFLRAICGFVGCALRL